MKTQTFMQQFRAYKRQIYRDASIIPTLDPHVVSRFGYKRTHQFMRYDSMLCRHRPCDIHTRINYRAHATAKPHYWRENAKRLTQMWRSWNPLK